MRTELSILYTAEPLCIHCRFVNFVVCLEVDKVARAVLSMVLGAAVLLKGGAASAQDALRSTLTLDRTLEQQRNPTVNLQPDQPHLGPVQLSLGLYTSGEFNDNINTSQSQAQADTLLRAGVRAGFVWPATEQSELRLNASVGYAHYLEHSQYDSLELAPDSALAWNISFEDAILTLYDQFSYSRQVIAESALSGLAVFPHFDNTIGGRLSWQPNQWMFETGYSHNNYFSDSTQFQYLDRASEFLFGRGAWSFAEKTRAGLEVSASLTKYRLPIQSDNSSVSVGPYAEWQVTKNFRASLRGGPTFYFFDSNGSSSKAADINSYYLGFELEHRLTDFVSHHLNVQRDVRLGLNQGSDYLEQLSINYGVSWLVTSRLALTATFTYEQGSQPLETPIYLPFGVFLLRYTEDFDRFGTGATISWRFTEKLSTSLGYGYWLRESNLPERGYTQNHWSVQLDYSF
jgi:hypothetical protein